MEQSEVRKTVAAQFYRSLNESGTSITSIPAEQLDALVNAMADSVFAVLDALEEESQPEHGLGASAGNESGDNQANPRSQGGPPVDDRPEPGTVAHPQEENLIWRGRPYLTIGTRYELSNQRIRILRGILGNSIEEIELIRIKDTTVKQHMGERMLNVGDVTVFSADATTPNFTLHNVRNPIEVRELIRKAVLDEKARRGLYYREDVGE